MEYFFRIHDPTTPNRQGNDVGTQYRYDAFPFALPLNRQAIDHCRASHVCVDTCRSAIFYHDEQQKADAQAVKEQLQGTKIKNPIMTEIVPFDNWWTAEEYHQKYLVNNPGGYWYVCAYDHDLMLMTAVLLTEYCSPCSNHYERW